MKKVTIALVDVNPPTRDTSNLIQYLKENTENVILFPKAQTVPSDIDVAIKYARKIWPGMVIEDQPVNSVLEATQKAYNAGYRDIVISTPSKDKRLLEGRYEDLSNSFPEANISFSSQPSFTFSRTKILNALAEENYSFLPKMPFMVRKSLIRSFRKTDDIDCTLPLNEELEILTEGINDPSIFKIVFIAGGPGSGKDFIVNKLLSGTGLVELNSDTAFEFVLKKNNLSLTMPDSEMSMRDLMRGRAKAITQKKFDLMLNGRLGMIINGTGDDPAKYAKMKKEFEALGYDTAMIFVKVADEISKQRNIERGQRGGRTVPEVIRKEKWDGSIKSMETYQRIFGRNFIVVDNSTDMRNVDDATRAQIQDSFKRMSVFFKKFVSASPRSKQAENWINGQMQQRGMTSFGQARSNKFGSGQMEDMNEGIGDWLKEPGEQFKKFFQSKKEEGRYAHALSEYKSRVKRSSGRRTLQDLAASVSREYDISTRYFWDFMKKLVEMDQLEPMYVGLKEDLSEETVYQFTHISVHGMVSNHGLGQKDQSRYENIYAEIKKDIKAGRPVYYIPRYNQIVDENGEAFIIGPSLPKPSLSTYAWKKVNLPIFEEGGAGEEGTNELVAKYKKDTPYQPQEIEKVWEKWQNKNVDFNDGVMKEGKNDYKIYHNTFTSAIEEAKRFAYDRGYDVDPEEMAEKIGLGPKKPSEGKTNRYIIDLKHPSGKVMRQKLQIQVYGMGNRYELNVYIG